MDRTVVKGHLAMASAGVMWGFMSPVGKWVMEHGTAPMALASMRMIGAAVLFWLASCFFPRQHVRRGDLGKFFLAGLFGIVLNQGSFTFGVGLTAPSDAALVTTTLPMITLLFSCLFLHEELSMRKAVGVAASGAGAALLICSTARGGGCGNVWGDVLCLCSQVSAAGYFVFFRRLLARYSPVTLMKWMFLSASVCALPFACHSWAQLPAAALEPKAWAGIVYVVAGATFLCYMLMPIAQRVLKPTVVSLYNYLQPIVATSIAIWWGMDTFTPLKALSAGMIFAGVFLVSTCPSCRRSTPRAARRAA